MERSRQPSGIPTGGQFARETKRRGDTDTVEEISSITIPDELLASLREQKYYAPLFRYLPSSGRPAPTFIWMDSEGRVGVDYQVEYNATPIDVYLNRTFQFPLFPELSGEDISNLLSNSEIQQLLTLIHNKHSVEWNGSNLVGRLDEEGYEKIAELNDIIHDMALTSLEDTYDGRSAFFTAESFVDDLLDFSSEKIFDIWTEQEGQSLDDFTDEVLSICDNFSRVVWDVQPHLVKSAVRAELLSRITKLLVDQDDEEFQSHLWYYNQLPLEERATVALNRGYYDSMQ